MTGERTRSERLLHETVGASVLPRHLGHGHLHTHIFAYANICVNPWWIAERTQLGSSVLTAQREQKAFVAAGASGLMGLKGLVRRLLRYRGS